MTHWDPQGDSPARQRKASSSPAYFSGAPSRSDHSGGKPHLLIVDDEASIRLSLERFLTRQGYRVSIARNGCEALAILGETAIDLVITDLVMPEFDGRQLILQMRSEYPATPVLVISGYPAALLPEPGPDGKPVPFLAKPFDLEALAAEIQRLLQQRVPKASGESASSGT